MTDFQLENHGSIVLLRPLTDAAAEWIADTCSPDPWQCFAGAVAVEWRFAPALVEALTEEGFTCGAST